MKRSRGVVGYEPISCPHSGHGWGGLQWDGKNAVLSGSANHDSQWFYAVGSYAAWRDASGWPGIPGPRKKVLEVELHARTPGAENWTLIMRQNWGWTNRRRASGLGGNGAWRITFPWDEYLNPPEAARRYSSVWTECCTALNQSMLDSSTAWAAKSASPGQWIEIDLGFRSDDVDCWSVAGIIVQGCNSRSYGHERVTQLSVSYKRSFSSRWEKVRPFLMDVVGSKNYDDTHHVLYFDEPVVARYIRVEPTLWRNYPTMRCGFIARPASKEQTAPQAPSEEEIER